MKQSKITQSTRGEWKSGQLKWCVLALLRRQERFAEEGSYPLITAKGLALLTGASYHSLQTLLLKWCRARVIRRDETGFCRKYHGPVFGYSITARGHKNFIMLTEGYISRRHHRWVQIDATAMLHRLQAIQVRLPKGGVI